MKHLKQLSKFLAKVLRHEADRYGLTLDAQGFTDLASVWQIIQRTMPDTTWEDLLSVVEGDETGKKRYEIQGERIRAMYGHSQVSDVTYEPVVPPAILYHGTNRKALTAILRDGLQPMKRQYVHLTTNPQRALTVAQRRSDDLVLIEINALEAYQDGVIFYQAETEHYLVKALPPQYLHLAEESTKPHD